MEEKQRIVTESYGGPGLVSVTARRNGLSISQLFTWRRSAREGKLSGDAAPVLVPVEITPAAAPSSSGARQPCLHRLRKVRGRHCRGRAWRRVSRAR
ncbi:transposase [Bradyrhizobium guangdongense]